MFTFEQVIKTPTLREGFLKGIVAKIGKPRYVKTVSYESNPENLDFLPEEDRVAARATIYPRLMMRLWAFGEAELSHMRIYVYPYAFSGEVLKTEDDFISALRSEYAHAKAIQQKKIGSIDFQQFTTVDGKMNQDLWRDILEVAELIDRLTSDSGISWEYQEHLIGKCLEYYTNIWEHEKDLPAEFIRELKVSFFRPWMLTFLGVHLEKQDGKGRWYFVHYRTGRKCYFPEEIEIIEVML